MIAHSKYEKYLQEICRRYEQWWNEVALTDTIANQQASFSFEQMVQTEEKTKTEEKPQKISLPIFQGIQNYLKSEHILLVGSPGVGKSTALLRCLISFAKEELEKPEPRIPVLVQLKRYNARFSNSDDPSGILRLIKDTLEPELWLEISEINKLLFKDKRLILLLDGLNEMPAGTVRTELEEFRKKCARCDVPLICTTREGGGTLDIKRQLEIQPLNPLEIERFLRECMPDQGQQVSQLLNRDNRELSRTPFVLWMLYQLFQEKGIVVETLGEAFRQFFKYFKKYKEDAPVTDERREDWHLWLECLAFTMLNSPPNETGLVISEERAEKVLTERFGELAGASSRIKELLKYHLLERVSEKEVSFHHQLIQEYYAAECLLPQLSELIKEQPGQKYTRFQIDYLNYLKWTEAIAIMLGLPEITENQAKHLIELALDVDLYLGARLAGEVKPKWQEKTVGLVAGLQISKLVKIEILGVTKSGQTIPQLEKALEDRNAFIRWLAVLSLTKIGNVAAVHALAKALTDENSSIRWRTISALKAIGNEAAVKTLVKDLTYKDCDTRKNVANALGEIKNVAAVESLVQALEDDEADVRSLAASALGRIGDFAATNALIKALKHRINDVRKNAASALGKIKNVTAVESLIQALKDDDADVRSSAASALGEIGDPAAVHALVQALKEDTYVCASAADALGKIGVGDSDTVDALVNALKDKSRFVRQNAVQALDKVGNSTAIDGLIELLLDDPIFSVNLSALSAINNISNSANGLVQALKHENPGIRCAAASHLSEFSSFSAISALVQALEDEVPSVREEAAFALARIGNPDTVDSLVKALKDTERLVRSYAASALGKIGDPTAVNSLVQVLKDKEAIVRRNAAISLRQIGNPAAINALVENLENEDEEIRCQAIFALKKIGKDAAIISIVESLKDESQSVRSNVIYVLKKIGNSTAIDGLVQALEDQEDDIRRSAVNALGEIGTQTAIEALIKSLEHKHADVRHNAVIALSQIDNPTAVNALIKALENEDADVRYRAASALGKIGNSSTVNNLLIVLKDEDASVRGSAASALGKIGSPTAVSALIEALEDKVSSVANNAAYALGEIANPTAINALIDVLADEDSVVYESAALILGRIGNAAAVDGLVKIFKRENSNFREDAASFLGEISNLAAVNVLVEALQDENQDVREDAASVLNKVSKPIAINALAHALKNENFVAANQGHTFCLATKALQAIQESCKCYSYEIYQQAQEADNLGFENNIIRKLYEDIDKVISLIRENPELRQNDKEDRLTIDIVNQLRCFGYDASHETKIGGHVDLVVRKDDLLWLGEAKIYSDNNYLWEGFLQLTTRYSIGDSNQEHGGLLIYIRQGDASSIMKKWQEYLLSKNLPDYSFKPCKMNRAAFISTHRHERSGKPFHVRHIPVMLHFAPQDKSGRRRKASPQTPKTQ
jgi:HEAT repeat protein